MGGARRVLCTWGGVRRVLCVVGVARRVLCALGGARRVLCVLGGARRVVCALDGARRVLCAWELPWRWREKMCMLLGAFRGAAARPCCWPGCGGPGVRLPCATVGRARSCWYCALALR